MKKDTNPVQQRMEYLSDSWNDIPKAQFKIICTIIEPEDRIMIDTFYQYMLGINVPITDIAINLNTGFDDIDEFSYSLVSELENIVNLWNKADFSKTPIDKVIIDWKPDYTIIESKNKAKLFVDNLNSLVEVLDLQKGKYLIVNLFLPYICRKEKIRKWLSEYLLLSVHPQLKLLVTDTIKDNIYQDVSFSQLEEVYRWEPHIDTSNVISQVAAMGDPQDPGTAYRLSFTKMMKAIAENKSKTVEKEAFTCLDIACNNTGRDPYWITQVVAVNMVMSNEYIKNKQVAKAYDSADKAIKIGETVPEVLGETLGSGILAQAQVNKASLLCIEKKWDEAIALYEAAADNFIKSSIYITALDAYRMAAFCAAKDRDSKTALVNLVKGYNLSDNIDNRTLRNSSFGLLLFQLTKLDHEREIPFETLEIKAKGIYGEDWQEIINQTWSQTTLENLYDDNPYLTEQANITTT